MSTHRLTRDAMLTGVALIIFSLELMLPGLTPVPGIKLGLSYYAFCAFRHFRKGRCAHSRPAHTAGRADLRKRLRAALQRLRRRGELFGDAASAQDSFRQTDLGGGRSGRAVSQCCAARRGDADCADAVADCVSPRSGIGRHRRRPVYGAVRTVLPCAYAKGLSLIYSELELEVDFR